MKKCTKCNFKQTDIQISEKEGLLIKGFWKIYKNICPVCDSKLEYINEFKIKCDKYKK